MEKSIQNLREKKQILLRLFKMKKRNSEKH